MLDFDGLASIKAGARLDRPEDFGDAVLAEIRKRLPPAFKAVDCLLVATSSTGLPFNSRDEPANGCACFAPYFCCRALCSSASRNNSSRAQRAARPRLPRLVDLLHGAVRFCRQAEISRRHGRPDSGAGSPAQGRPVPGRRRNVLMEVNVELASPKGRRGARGTSVGAEERRLDVDPSIRHELIVRLVGAIPNDTVDHGGDWIAVLHGIKGASGDPDWGKIIWLAYCARWTKGEADPDEDERVWDTARLGDGFSGIRQLLELAWRAGTPEAIAAVEAVKLAQAQWAFRDPPDPVPDAEPDPPPRIVCPTIFKGQIPPARRWIVPQWIPCDVVTGFYGDGGVGKSLLAQQLQTATALGSTWLGLPVERSPASASIARTKKTNCGGGNAPSIRAISPTTTPSARCTGCRAWAKTIS